MPRFRTTFVSPQHAFGLGVEEESGVPFLDLVVATDDARLTEQYRLTQEQYDRFSADPVQALDFVAACIARRNEDLLFGPVAEERRGAAAPLADRPETPKAPIISEWLGEGRHPTLRFHSANAISIASMNADTSDMPRTAYVGGEVFIGIDVVDRDGEHEVVTEVVAQRGNLPYGALMEETRARVIGYRPDAIENPNGFPRVIADEAYAASLLLAARPRGAEDPDDGLIAFVLGRDCAILFTERQADEGVHLALERAEALLGAGTPLLSTHPLVRRDGSWRPYDWRAAHPDAVERIGAVERKQLVHAYAAQAAEIRNEPAHVADAELRIADDGTLTTFTTWPAGTEAVLPVVDEVVVAGTGRAIPYAEFLEHAGDALGLTEYAPLRFRIPSDFALV
ncbi:hypothetical protein [Microbacterium halophytorum]|uniref:hypothetical protein n=1 Tax=Microbacterium halophytorum TaxID=2067568 RepID=UPI000CFC57A2|nr:hypothetical protein [Microbacterium halophytorum]